MNRNLLYSIIAILITVGIGYYVFVKSNEKDKVSFNNLDFVPYKSTFFIAEIENPLETFDEIFNSNLIWKELIPDNQFKIFGNFWKGCDSIFVQNNLTPERLTFALCENGEEYDLFFNIKIQEEYDFESLNFNKDWVVKNINNRLIFSNSRKLITRVEKQLKDLKSIIKDSSFNEIYSEKVKNKSAVFVKLNKFTKVFNFGNQHIVSQDKFGWGLFDISLKTESFFINGYVQNSQFDEISNEMDKSFFHFTPNNFKEILVFNYDTISQIPVDNSYIETVSNSCKCDAFYHAYNWIDNQVIYFNSEFNNLKYVGLKISSVKNFKESLMYFTPDSLQLYFNDSIEVKKLNSMFDFSKLLSISVKFTHYVWLDDYIVFGESEQALNRVLFDVLRKETIEENKEIITFYKNNRGEKAVFSSLTKGVSLGGKKMDNGISLFQLFPDSENRVYTSLSYSKEIIIGGEKTNIKWDLNFKNNLSNPIFITKNHRTNDVEYLFQDNVNELFMVSPIGEVKWRKKIDGKIIGQVKNIDVLGNNKYQMVFNTSKKLYVVDVLGNSVTGFPVTFPTRISNGISIIDYDKKGNYRFLVASSSGILSFDKTGKTVTGWVKPKQKGIVLEDVKHLILQHKDYLLVKDSLGQLYFYNRKGEVRHSVSSIFSGDLNTISFGNSISTTSYVYLDTNTNSIVKQYFGKTFLRKLLEPKEKIRQFYNLDFDLDGEKDYILISDKEVIIYGVDLVFKKRVFVDKGYKKISVNENYIFYINSFGELMVVSNSTDKISDLGMAEDYKITKYKEKTRILIQNRKNLRLVII